MNGQLVDEPGGFPRLHWAAPHWVVLSFELAPQIAHSHANVLKAARTAEAAGLPACSIVWTHYRRREGMGRGCGRRALPCCLLTRAGLVAAFDHLHNVPRCRDIRAVLDEYLTLFARCDQAGPGQQAAWQRPAEPDPTKPSLLDKWDLRQETPSKYLEAFRASLAPPAPDEAIAPPEGDERLFDPVAVPADAPPSWQVNAAVLTLRRSGLPRYLSEDLDRWNTERCAALYAAARSWTDAEQIFATKEVE